MSTNIRELVSSITNLPPAPRVMPMLLRLLDDMNASTEDIVQLLELDAGLAAKLLNVSNSAFYGGKGDISDIGEAVGRLGFKEIYRIVTNLYAKAFVGKPMDSYKIESEERWFNSVATGIIMELLSRKMRVGDAATSYTVGLLHDIGKTAIDELFGERYGQVLNAVEHQQISIQEAEKNEFGFDHAEIGAALLEHWEFPVELIEPIRYQLLPKQSEQPSKVAYMLHLSRWVCASIGGAPGAQAWAFSLDEAVFDVLECSSDIALELILESREEIQRKEELLRF